jgi:hypothetical protein
MICSCQLSLKIMGEPAKAGEQVMPPGEIGSSENDVAENSSVLS